MPLTLRPVHRDRYSPTTHLRKGGLVIHTAESPDGAAQSLINLMARPGDQPSTSRPGEFFGASYHAVTSNDPTDPIGYVQVQGADHGPYSAPPLNAYWWHICIPGYARQTRAEWLDPESLAGIRGAARYAVAKADADDFALTRRPSQWLAAFATPEMLGVGYCGHVDVSLAWRKSTHTDPGAAFPWDVFAGYVAQFTDPEGETMNTARLVRQKGFANVFLVGGNAPALQLSPEMYDNYLAAGVVTLPAIVIDHPQAFACIVNQAFGETAAAALAAGLLVRTGDGS